MKTVPVDVRGLATALGLKVVEDRLSPNVSGKIERDWFADDAFVITVNASHSETRKRFTIAHEIAHFVLHRDQIGDGVTDDGMYRSETLSTSVERQANQYAADILMPWNLVQSDPAFRAGRAGAWLIASTCRFRWPRFAAENSPP